MTKELNLTIGKTGEEIAKEYLEKRGYKVLEQNVKNRFGEIDLVAQHGKELVIIEVRTKTGDMYGTPEESLTKKKLRKLRLNAMNYVKRKGWKGDYRIDAVCVVLGQTKQQPERVEHYEKIF